MANFSVRYWVGAAALLFALGVIVLIAFWALTGYRT